MIRLNCPHCSAGYSGPLVGGRMLGKCKKCGRDLESSEQRWELSMDDEPGRRPCEPTPEVGADPGFELVDENAEEEVGALCRRCLKVVPGRSGQRVHCPACGDLLETPEREEVARSAIEPHKPVVQSPTPPALPPAPKPAPTGYVWTKNDWIEAVMMGFGALVFSVAVVHFLSDIFAEKPKPKGYQPQYPEYYGHPGLAPIDRVKEWSPEDKNKVRDAVIEFEKAQGRLR